jgi:hypothetical protein
MVSSEGYSKKRLLPVVTVKGAQKPFRIAWPKVVVEIYPGVQA